MKEIHKQTTIAFATDAAPMREAMDRDDFASQRRPAFSMIFVYRAAIAALTTFVSALTGMFAQWLLTASYVDDSRSMIGSVVGLVATLLSVVIGLLVWTSYGLFNTQQSDVETLGRSIAYVGFFLRQFGPEAIAARAVLRKQALQARSRFWPDDAGGRPRPIVYETVHADVQTMFAALAALRPTDEEQLQSLAMVRENFAKFIETQMSMIRTLANRVPNLLLNVVAGWACALFFGYGLLAGINALTFFMAVLGSAAVASATFLILEMSDPYSGLFRISSASFDQLIREYIDQS